MSRLVGSERYRAGGECVAVFAWSADERDGDVGERGGLQAAGQLTDLERLGSETSTCTGFRRVITISTGNITR